MGSVCVPHTLGSPPTARTTLLSTWLVGCSLYPQNPIGKGLVKAC